MLGSCISLEIPIDRFDRLLSQIIVRNAMSVARPTQCVFCIFRRSARPPASTRRSLHATVAPRQKRSRPSNVPEEDDVDIPAEGRRALRVPKNQWGKQYTSKQLEAIRAAQEVIPPDAFDKGRNPTRVDPWSIEYYDNLDKIDPVIDKPVLAPWENIDDTSRLKDEEEIEDDLAKMVENPPENEEAAADLFESFDRGMRLTVGSEAHERNPRSAMAPIPPPPPKPKAVVKESDRGEEKKRYEEEPSPALVRLMQMTGYSREEIVKLRVKSLISHRVVNQTRLGKIGKMYFLSVAGNGNGLLGIGEGKSEEPSEARLQSQYRAIRNMMPILRYEKRTIYGDVKAKVSATELELMARPPGMQLVSSHRLRD